MDKIVDVETFKKEAKKRERKEALAKRANEIKDFIIQNKEVITTVTPVVAGIGVKLYRESKRKQKVKAERDLKNLYCYDRSLGHYWKLKRELSNQEWADIARRKESGEALYSILSSMKVLK